MCSDPRLQRLQLLEGDAFRRPGIGDDLPGIFAGDETLGHDAEQIAVNTRISAATHQHGAPVIHRPGQGAAIGVAHAVETALQHSYRACRGVRCP